MVTGGLDAAKKLGESGLKVRVLDRRTIKPLDLEFVNIGDQYAEMR